MRSAVNQGGVELAAAPCDQDAPFLAQTTPLRSAPPALPPALRRCPDPLFHGVMLAITATVLLLSMLLQIQEDQRLRVPLLGMALPSLCNYQRWFSMDCPGCGLTRCFVSLGHGDLRAAWQYNAVGILFFVLVCSQIPYRGMQLWRGLRGAEEWQPGRWGVWPVWILLLGLILQWAGKTVWQYF